MLFSSSSTKKKWYFNETASIKETASVYTEIHSCISGVQSYFLPNNTSIIKEVILDENLMPNLLWKRFMVT